jgi:hypothetical protein
VAHRGDRTGHPAATVKPLVSDEEMTCQVGRSDLIIDEIHDPQHGCHGVAPLRVRQRLPSLVV